MRQLLSDKYCRNTVIKTNISFGLIMDTFPTPFLYAVLLHLINHSSTGQNFRPSDCVIGSSAIHQGGTCQRKGEFGCIWFGVFWWLFFFVYLAASLPDRPTGWQKVVQGLYLPS